MLAFTTLPNSCLLPFRPSKTAQQRVTGRPTSFIPSSVKFPPCTIQTSVTAHPRVTISLSPPTNTLEDSPFDLDTELTAMSEKFKKLPSERAPIANHENVESATLSKSSLPLEDFSDDLVAQAKDIASSSDTLWSTEEQQVYSILADSHTLQHASSPSLLTGGDIAPSIETLKTGLYDNDGPANPEQVSTFRSHQAHPRRQSSSRLRQALEAVTRRSSLLATERAEDTVRDPSLSHSDRNSNPDSDNLHQLLHELRIDNARNVIPNSIRNSFIIDLQEEAGSPDHSAITSALARHVITTCATPMTYRPFLAMHTAFHEKEHPPCARCATPTSRSDRDSQNGLCSFCYSKIYLQAPSHTSPNRIDQADGTFTSREDRLREQARLADEARNVVRASMADDASTNSSATSAVPSSKSSSSGTGRASDGASGGGGGGGGRGKSVNEATWQDGWNVAASDRALRTINPIRNLIQNIQVTPNPSKKAIKLSIGDPTVYGNLAVSDEVLQAFSDSLWQRRANGYSMSMGNLEPRVAVAKRYSTKSSPLAPDDVLLACGTSGALELAISSLANEGDNILLPRPGFPLFQTIADNLGVECRYYRLNADKGWEVELGDLSAVADERTRAILVNNPSNPCGSVFSISHMEDIVAVASSLRVPIVADEVYADMVFGDTKFKSFGEVSDDVPVLSVGGISKQFVVPGWRLGWVTVHDRNDIFTRGDVRKGLKQLTTRMITPSTPAQTIVPMLLEKAPGFREVMDELSENAEFSMAQLKDVPGLRCIKPDGAMYMMVEVDVQAMGLRDDMEFVETLYEEESVFLLPGQCFQLANFVRVVFAAPKEVLADAFDRIAQFCARRMQ